MSDKTDITDVMVILEKEREKAGKTYDKLKTSGTSTTNAAINLRKYNQINYVISILSNSNTCDYLQDGEAD